MGVDPAILSLLNLLSGDSGSEVSASPAERREQIEAGFGAMAAALPQRENFTAVDIAEHTVPGPTRDIPVRIFTPHGREPALPALLYFFGGGFWMRTYNSADILAACSQIAEQANVIVVEIDYALAPESPYPAAMLEGDAVLRWMHDEGDSVGIDPTKLAVGGQSSGGTIAASVSLYVRDNYGPPISLQLLEVPALDLSAESITDSLPAGPAGADAAGLLEALMFYLPEGIPEGDVYASPAAANLEGLPPTLVVMAENDPLRLGGEQFASRLRLAGVEVVSVTYGGQVHMSPGLAGVSVGAHAWRDQVSWAVSTLHSLPGRVL